MFLRNLRCPNWTDASGDEGILFDRLLTQRLENVVDARRGECNSEWRLCTPTRLDVDTIVGAIVLAGGFGR
jgi:hypothetical protein